MYAVFFIHLFRLRWISLLKINTEASRHKTQLLHFCPADLNPWHLFSYNPSHRKFIYTDRDFWNFAGLVNLQHSRRMSFSIKITLPRYSMPRVNIWADEARVLCLFTQKLKYCSSSFKKPSWKEKTHKMNYTHPICSETTVTASLGTHATNLTSHTLASVWQRQRKQQLQHKLSFSCTGEMG